MESALSIFDDIKKHRLDLRPAAAWNVLKKLQPFLSCVNMESTDYM